MLTLSWRPGRPVDLHRTVGSLRHGSGDPARRVDADGTFWWAAATPSGDGTLALRQVAGGVDATAWGSGAGWLLDQVPSLLGASDDWSCLDVSAYPLLRDVQRRHPGVRLPSTGLVMDALVPAVLEQRVTGMESRRSWRGLLYRFGTVAPGPASTMRVPPSARVLLDVPSWDWHKLGVDISRQRALRAAATVASRLEECVSLPSGAALARLRVVPGIGPWTAAETLQRAMGHPDAVSVDDFHIHDIVVHTLTGRPRGTDEEMLALLEPWFGQRQRVVRLVELAGVGKPRFGPRYAPLDTRAI